MSPEPLKQTAPERRNKDLPVSTERRDAAPPPAPAAPKAVKERTRTIPIAGKDRRKGPIDPPVSDEETSFVSAMERYKRENRRPFPTWSEVLEVLRALGYRKVEGEIEPSATNDMPPPKG